MRRVFDRPIIIYFTFLFFMASTSVVFSILKLTLTFTTLGSVFSFIIQVFIDGTFYILCRKKKSFSQKTDTMLAYFLPLLAFICFFNGPFLVLNEALRFLGCFFILLLYKSRKWYFIMSMAVDAIMAVPIYIISFFVVIFGFAGALNTDTVIKEVPSPKGTYTAIVIDNDQGALGGSTYVQIEYNHYDIDFGLGTLSRVEGIYSGRYGESFTMEVHWIDDNTVLLDGVSYKIK